MCKQALVEKFIDYTTPFEKKVQTQKNLPSYRCFINWTIDVSIYDVGIFHSLHILDIQTLDTWEEGRVIVFSQDII